VALHVGSAVVPDQRGWPARVLLAGMAAACVPCVRALSRAPTPRVWTTTGAMYAVMLTAHLLTMTPGAGGMRHGDAGLTWGQLGMWAFVVLAAAQLLLVAAALLLTGLRRSAPAGGDRYRPGAVSTCAASPADAECEAAGSWPVRPVDPAASSA
jgi:hypothetical protein